MEAKSGVTQLDVLSEVTQMLQGLGVLEMDLRRTKFKGDGRRLVHDSKRKGKSIRRYVARAILHEFLRGGHSRLDSVGDMRWVIDEYCRVRKIETVVTDSQIWVKSRYRQQRGL